jgi:hypothetical protein
MLTEIKPDALEDTQDGDHLLAGKIVLDGLTDKVLMVRKFIISAKQ